MEIVKDKMQGKTYIQETPGNQNTGGGGGGGSTQGASPPYSPEADSGSGGSGIVLIAYPS